MESKRINFSVDQKELIKKLTTDSSQFPAIFESNQKALMFAAALGRHLRRREKEFRRYNSSAIRYDIFQNNGDDSFIDALAVAVTGDLKILADDKFSERISIFEEYAYVGLQEIETRCYSRPGNPLDALVNLVSDMEKEEHEIFEDDEKKYLLEEIAKNLNQLY
jgi:dnd system-associated protein 4